MLAPEERPYVADLRAARAGVLLLCRGCALVFSLDTERVCALRFGHVRLGRLPRRCAVCGGREARATVTGLGWYVDGLNVRAPRPEKTVAA